MVYASLCFTLFLDVYSDLYISFMPWRQQHKIETYKQNVKHKRNIYR